MKFYNLLTSPITLAISFSFLMISGDKISWFYIVGLMLGLGQGYAHAIIGTIAIFIMISTSGFRGVSKELIRLCGAFMMLISLAFFFANDSESQNNNTFLDPFSQVTFILFGIILLLFLFRQFGKLISASRPNF